MAIEFQLRRLPLSHALTGGRAESRESVTLEHAERATQQRLRPRIRGTREDSTKGLSGLAMPLVQGLKIRGARSGHTARVRNILGRGPTALLSLKGDLLRGGTASWPRAVSGWLAWGLLFRVARAGPTAPCNSFVDLQNADSKATNLQPAAGMGSWNSPPVDIVQCFSARGRTQQLTRRSNIRKYSKWAALIVLNVFLQSQRPEGSRIFLGVRRIICAVQGRILRVCRTYPLCMKSRG
jgi:hypothetical protein